MVQWQAFEFNLLFALVASHSSEMQNVQDAPWLETSLGVVRQRRYSGVQHAARLHDEPSPWPHVGGSDMVAAHQIFWWRLEACAGERRVWLHASPLSVHPDELLPK